MSLECLEYSGILEVIRVHLHMRASIAFRTYNSHYTQNDTISMVDQKL